MCVRVCVCVCGRMKGSLTLCSLLDVCTSACGVTDEF